MARTVFFSWQADTPTITGRNLLERALERALGSLNEKLDIDEPEREEIELDRDTKGVAGQPPIVETIFKKIDSAAVFVPDLTFVGKRLDGRPVPNPNVLVEYGWALKSLTHARIVAVMNSAYGEPVDSMPFDMRHLRNPITYHLPDDANEATRKKEREKLCKLLEDALRAVLKESPESESKVTLPQQYVPVAPQVRMSRFRPSTVALGIATDAFDRPEEIYLAQGDAIWLRAMPVIAPGRTWSAVELRAAANNSGIRLAPLSSGVGYNVLRADDGLGHYAPSTPNVRVTPAIAFAFETGEVWGINTGIVARIKSRGRGGLPILDLERVLGTALTSYVDFLSQLNVPPPYRWIAGIEGIKKFGLYYPAPPGKMWMDDDPKGACVADVVVEEGSLPEGALPYPAMFNFINKIFIKCGLEGRPEYFNPGSTGAAPP